MSQLQIQTKNRKFETAKDLYGIFSRISAGRGTVASIRNSCETGLLRTLCCRMVTRRKATVST